MSNLIFGKTDQPRKLTAPEIAKAVIADPKEFPQEMPCLQCGFMWMQHCGKLCPERPGAFALMDFGDHFEYVPVTPKWGNTTFIPDLEYFNTNPPFEVQ